MRDNTSDTIESFFMGDRLSWCRESMRRWIATSPFLRGRLDGDLDLALEQLIPGAGLLDHVRLVVSVVDHEHRRGGDAVGASFFHGLDDGGFVAAGIEALVERVGIEAKVARVVLQPVGAERAL